MILKQASRRWQDQFFELKIERSFWRAFWGEEFWEKHYLHTTCSKREQKICHLTLVAEAYPRLVTQREIMLFIGKPIGEGEQTK